MLAIAEIKRLITEASEDFYEDPTRIHLLMDDIKYWHNLYSSLVTDSSLQEQMLLLEQQINQFNETKNRGGLPVALNALVDSLFEKVSTLRLSQPKDYGQDWFLSRMKALGYSFTHELDLIKGHCYGIAHMGLQAFLANDITTFNQRIAIIKSIPVAAYQNDFALLKQERDEMLQQGLLDKANEINQKISDILAFFDGVSVLQNAFGKNYTELFEDKYPVQSGSRVMPLVRSLVLDDIDNSPLRIQSVSGAYNRKELIQYITLLKENLGMNSFSLVFMSSQHEINLNYDHTNQQWQLIDANQLPAQIYIQPDLIADAVLDAFTFGSVKREGLVVHTEIYTKTKHALQLRNNLSSLENLTAWRSIHEVSTAKLEHVYPPDPLNQLQYALIHQNSQLIKQVNDIVPELLNKAIRDFSLTDFPEKGGILALIAKQLEGAAGIDFFINAYYLSCLEERGPLIALTADSVPEWMTSPAGFNKITWSIIKQHTVVIFNSVQFHLIERINSPADFRDVIQYLPPEQQCIVFDGVQARLFEWINSPADFRNVIHCLSPEQQRIVFEGVRAHLFEWINSLADFRDVIQYLSPEQQRIVFDGVKASLFEWINSPADFRDVIQYLSPEQQRIVFDGVQGNLFESCTTGDFEYIWQRIPAGKLDDLLFECLMRNFQKWITTRNDLTRFTVKLRRDPMKINVFYEKMVNDIAELFANEIDSLQFLRYENLTENLNDLIILSIKGRLSVCVSEFKTLEAVLEIVSPNVKIIVLETIKDQLPALIKEHSNLMELQEKLSPDNFNLVLTAIKDQLPMLIKNFIHLANLSEPLSLDGFAIVLDAIKDNLSLILMPIGIKLERLLCKLSSEKRSLVFESMEHHFPQFSGLIKASEREKLMEFYEGWCMEHENVESLHPVTKPGQT
jgi:hypothetical protein